MEALQQPNVELRSGALKTLGLFGISSENHCEAFAGIFIQVASADFENSYIRCQAIESLTDMSLVHSEAALNPDAVVKLLVRSMCSDDPNVRLVSKEASAKLLFSGRVVHSSELLAEIVISFFQGTQSYSDEEPHMDNSIDEMAQSHLGQILSIFFPAFCQAGGKRPHLLLESVSSLFSSSSMIARSGDAPPPIVKVS
jgi:hypothetical protein